MEKASEVNSLRHRSLTWAVYVLQVLGLFFLLPDFIGFVMNLVLRKEVTDPILKAHFRWQINTFLWSWGLALIGLALLLTVIGIPVAICLWIFAYIWYLYRVTRGMLSLSEEKPPKPGYN